MSASQNDPNDISRDLATLGAAEREVVLGIRVAEARVQRLLGDLFANRHSAENGMRRILRRHDLEYAIGVILQRSLERRFYFGGTNDHWYSAKRHLAQAALRELPEALRELHQLNLKQRDLAQGRLNHLEALQRRSNPARQMERHPDRTRERSR